MRRAFSFIVLATFFALPSLDAQQHQPELAWQSDWATAFRVARDERRLVLVDFFATWCVPCRQMDSRVMALPDVRERLSKFVLLRIDGDRQSKIRNAQKVSSYPTIVVFDPGERERLRVVGYSGPDPFRKMLDVFQPAAPDFLTASDLFDAGKDIDANFLAAKTYNRLGLFGPARVHYAAARDAAVKIGKKGTSQLAEALSALTYARDGDSKLAIKLLRKLTASPADSDIAPFLWIALGNAHLAAKDSKSALDAFQRAQSTSSPGSPPHEEARKAIAKLK